MTDHPIRMVCMLLLISAAALALAALLAGPIAALVFIAGWLLGWLA